jgi:hypothetical protein
LIASLYLFPHLKICAFLYFFFKCSQIVRIFVVILIFLFISVDHGFQEAGLHRNFFLQFPFVHVMYDSCNLFMTDLFTFFTC